MPDRGWPPRNRLRARGGAGASLQEGIGTADQDAGHRHDRDRRRRRFDRRDQRGRPAHRRAALGGRRPGTGLLRARRCAADRHRRQSRARILRSGLLPRRPHDARQGRRHPRARNRRAAAQAVDARRRLGRAPHRHRIHGGGRARAPGRKGQGSAPLPHGRLRRRGAGARRGRRPPARRVGSA